EDNRRWESGMRVNIPDFDGYTLNPEGFIDWLAAVEEVFEFKEKPNRRVGSSSSPAITGVSGSGNAVSRFAPNQAKAGGGNTGLVPKATGISGLKCFNCGKPVHRQSECKKAEKRHLFADPDDNDDDVAYEDYEGPLIFNDEPEYEEEYVFGDMGVNLVGSCDNLIAEEVIQKLGLKTENHPKPYKLQWLKKGGEVTVSKRVHVPFLGSYDNLIAEEVIQKLGLKTENHPKPYKLQWLKKGGEVTVSKRVHVPFLDSWRKLDWKFDHEGVLKKI
nr:hypothetical protein [Tanacetum cinerariifolium]